MERRPEFDKFDPQTAMRLRLQEAERQLRSSELLAAEAGEMARMAQEHLSGRRYSFVRVIDAAASGSRLDGVELETSQELARRVARPHDPSKPFVPWSALAAYSQLRTLVAGTAAAGGDLIGKGITPAVLSLYPVSTVVRLGGQVLDNLVGDVGVPQVTAAASASWPGEAGTGSASSPTLGQYVAQPKPVISYVEFSKQLMRQAPDVSNRMIAGLLLGAVGGSLDAKMLSGTGGDEPTGILSWSGVTVTTGTGYDHAAAQAQLKTVSDSGVDDSLISFLGHGAVRELLAQRGVNGTGAEAGFIWQRNRIADKPAAVSANVGTASLHCGDFSQAWLMLWGGGIQVEINPFANFQASIIGARVLAHADCAIVRPAAFAVGTGIT